MNDQDFRHPMAARKEVGQLLSLSANGHPAYTPVKLNIKTAADMKGGKTKGPEKPMAPYMRYSRKIWDSVKASHPEAKLWEIGKIIGQMWRDLSDADKQEYIGDYENAKADYCEQLKIYHNSPQFQNFLSNNTKKKIGKNYFDDGKNGNGITTNALASNNIINTLGNTNRMLVNSNSDSSSHYAIEPAEDDGIDDSLTTRHLAAIRFNRNHRLINEIFSEYTIPDSRSIVTSQRMEQLKKQVHSLEQHQEKLKQELLLIEEKNEAKKRKILNASADFDKELSKLKEFKVTEEQTKLFFNKHYEQLQKQWKDHADRFVSTMPVSSGDNKAEDAQNKNATGALKEYLENIVYNNRNLISVLVPSPINIVALQQVVETTNVAPNPHSTPNQAVASQHPSITTSTAQNNSNATQHSAHHSPSVISQPNPNVNQISSTHHHQQQQQQQHILHHQQQQHPQINGPGPHVQNQAVINQQNQIPVTHPQPQSQQSQPPQSHTGHVNPSQIGPQGLHPHVQNTNTALIPNQTQHIHHQQQQQQQPHMNTQSNQPTQADYFQGSHLPYQNVYQQQPPPNGTGTPAEMMLQQQHQQNMYANQQNMYAGQQTQYMNQQAYGMQQSQQQQQQQRGIPNANYGTNPVQNPNIMQQQRPNQPPIPPQHGVGVPTQTPPGVQTPSQQPTQQQQQQQQQPQSQQLNQSQMMPPNRPLVVGPNQVGMNPMNHYMGQNMQQYQQQQPQQQIGMPAQQPSINAVSTATTVVPPGGQMPIQNVQQQHQMMVNSQSPILNRIQQTQQQQSPTPTPPIQQQPQMMVPSSNLAPQQAVPTQVRIGPSQQQLNPQQQQFYGQMPQQPQQQNMYMQNQQQQQQQQHYGNPNMPQQQPGQMGHFNPGQQMNPGAVPPNQPYGMMPNNLMPQQQQQMMYAQQQQQQQQHLMYGISPQPNQIGGQQPQGVMMQQPQQQYMFNQQVGGPNMPNNNQQQQMQTTPTTSQPHQPASNTPNSQAQQVTEQKPKGKKKAKTPKNAAAGADA